MYVILICIFVNLTTRSTLIIMEQLSLKSFNRLAPDKQSRILDASIKEFAEKGYQSASMNQVVDSAGIAKGSLFNYFKTKSSLFTYVYGLALNNVKDYLRAVRDKSEKDPFIARLEQIMYAGVQFIQDHPRLARIYFRILYTSDSPHSREILMELRKLSAGFLSEIIQGGIDRNELDKDLDIEKAVFILDSVLNRFLKVCHESPETVNVNEWVNSLCQLLNNGMNPK